MELGISKINYEDFVKIKALRKGTSGCLGSRQEFFVCDKLEEGECAVFKYENKEDYQRGSVWANQFCKRRNNVSGSVYRYEHFSVGSEFTVYLAKKYKEDN